MNSKKITTAIIALFAMFISTYSIAQKIEAQTATYVRNGLSIHFATPSGFSNDVLNSIKVSGKYDDNSFGDNILRLNSSYSGQGSSSNDKKSKTTSLVESEVATPEYQAVLEAIASQKIPNKVIAKILLNASGRVDYTTIFKRGEYNATDNTMIAANASNEGLSGVQSDAISNVINNVYLLIQQTGTITSKSSKDGSTYSVPFKSYLLQVDLSELFATNQFYKTFSANDADVAAKINNYNFKIKLISVSEGIGSTSDKELELQGLKMVSTPKSQEQIYTDLATATIDAGLTDHANNYEAFKVKTKVFSVGPITAKIGKKEGLRIDDRFEVFRNGIDKSTGDKFARKLGYVRVAKVADNEKVADGNSEPSKFYKAPARGIEKSDIMKELPETGIQVGVELAVFSGLDGESVTAPMVNIDYVTHLIKGNRLTASYLNYGGQNLLLAEARQILQLNRLTLTPGFGYIFALSSDGSTTSDEPGGISASFKIGLEFGKHFQIQAGPRFLASETGEMAAGFGFGLRLFGF
jgi:hypothetical protein